MFKPIGQTRSAVDLCADAIRDAILDGRFKVGDRLPPERALADMFDLNRLTIRGALTRLTAEGLLSVRQGSGYRVEDVYRTTGPAVLSSLLHRAQENSVQTSMIEDVPTSGVTWPAPPSQKSLPNRVSIIWSTSIAAFRHSKMLWRKMKH